MKYVIGALCGLVWGALAALVNREINKKALKKNKTNAIVGANTARTAVDIAALAVVFFLRNLLPFSYEMALVGTAVSLSVLTIVFAYRLTAPEKPPETANTESAEK